MNSKSLNMLCTLIMLCFCFAQCKKDKTAPTELSKLPAATQTGANTFGCLVNGKAYIPEGSSGSGTPNPKITYDVGLNGIPNVLISVNQYESNNQIGNFLLFIDSLTLNTSQLISTNSKQIGFGWNVIPRCGFLRSDTIQFKKGVIYITNYDFPNRIVSGTFDIKIKPNNCDTMFFKAGRFDFKF